MTTADAAPKSRRRINDEIRRAVQAVTVDDVGTLAQIVRKRVQANWMLPDRSGLDLLCKAVVSRSGGAVRWLLDTGADPNSVFCDRQRFGQTHALVEGHYVSALMLAINLREVGLVALLLEHGALPDLPIIIDDCGGRETCAHRMQIRLNLFEIDALRQAIKFQMSVAPGTLEGVKNTGLRL